MRISTIISTSSSLFLSSTLAHPNPPTATLPSHPNQENAKPVEIQGRHLPEFNQDIFLGIPYADEPPRFGASSLKTSYASSWDNGNHPGEGNGGDRDGNVVINATDYGLDCPAYGSNTEELVSKGLVRIGEDCLRLNIVRPCRRQHGSGDGEPGRESGGQDKRGEELLPVLIWIYGGGWQQGATADPR